ncbi:MAG TPA: type I methionyl aminopeptidase [Anaerolineales bacterium]|nr:type I methionyl aminopeptidase [Anaerolineales bacterium]HNA89310.1 type I methionyl aminopeptidase [Anaerolineales bacterium]HNB36479.1 type I methionyl aminopeptidase [Anaerolineales bacterium]HNC08257.1 type I methionyl aminopeptidase [Anaerolineales bacterium]HNO32115.1 type I methionyl aminopeptidase [Anaerolineales bacterium]
MTADSENDIKGLKAAGKVCAQALRLMMESAKPGMTTLELDQIGEDFLVKEGARSAPRTMYNFPGGTCISVSPVIAHGIPGDHTIQDGELINIDVSAEMGGYYGDTGASMVVGTSRPEYEKLLEATKSALARALSVARVGKPLNLIGKTIQQEAAANGFNVIYDLTGHGIGRQLHEKPSAIYNYYKPEDRRTLNEGLVLAIEPFLTTGQGHVVEKPDHWSLRTVDNTIAAQFEHTIIVTKGEPIILTMS